MKQTGCGAVATGAGAQPLESIGLVHGIHKKFGYAEFFWRENRAVIIPRARGGRHRQ